MNRFLLKATIWLSCVCPAIAGHLNFGDGLLFGGLGFGSRHGGLLDGGF